MQEAIDRLLSLREKQPDNVAVHRWLATLYDSLNAYDLRSAS